MLKNLGATGSGGSSGSSGAAKNLEAELDKVVKSAEKSADSVKKTMERAFGGSSVAKEYLNILKQVETAQSKALNAKADTNVKKVYEDAAAAARKAKAEFEAANTAFMRSNEAIAARNAHDAKIQQMNTLSKAAGYDAMSRAAIKEDNAQLQQYIALVVKAKEALAGMKTADAGSEQAKHWQSIAQNAMTAIHEIMRANPAMAEMAKNSDAIAKATEKYSLTMAKSGDKAAREEEIRQLNEYKRILKELETAKIGVAKSEEGSAERKHWEDMAAAAERAKVAFEGSNSAIANSAAGLQLQKESAERVAQAEALAAARAKDHAAAINSAQAMARTLYNWVVRMAVYRGLRTMWREATSYAKEYYNTLNEIQIVTMKSGSEMQSVSADIRSLAKDLGVSQTDVASAATTFYRQGLSQEDVNKRLEWTTKYSKVASVDMEEAASQITAVVNSMGSLEGNVQRVVDVFVYLGDHAATSGAEIAAAMQKAAATADSAGMEFEFLASAISVVSETTRLAPESIGTAFNTMMTRLHSIKQNGYNEEDETKVNDIAKALNTVGIELLNQEGEWNRLDDIFTKIAAKWDTMTNKQQSYIATTLAGVRSQNYFNALMNDMAKGSDSRFQELYSGAKMTEGIVDEKYEVWLDSVTAAQERMKNSLQELYSVILNGDVMKGFYGTITNIVNAVVKASNGFSGVAIKVALLSGAFAALIVTVYKLITAWTGMKALVTAHPYAVIASAVIVAISAIVALTAAIGDEKQSLEDLKSDIDNNLGTVSDVLNSMNEDYSKLRSYRSDIESLRDEYVELSSKSDRTAGENARLQEILDKIAQICPDVADKIGLVTGAYSYQYEIVKALNDEITKMTKENLAIMEQKWNSEGLESALKAAEGVKE